MRLLIRNARLVDEQRDAKGDLEAEGGCITRISAWAEGDGSKCGQRARTSVTGETALEIDASGLVLMPAFVDLHAHFRDPGFPEKETLESACLAATAGGFATVVCMANTMPVMSEPDAAAALRSRSEALGLLDLRPALSLTRGFDGRDVAHLAALSPAPDPRKANTLLASEDGLDLADDEAFLAALRECARLDLLASCHCEHSAGTADARVAEDSGTERALRLGRIAGARVHIAHVSTAGALEAVRQGKREATASGASRSRGFRPSCEATPHHLCLNDSIDYRVNPPLRPEADRLALIEGLKDGTVDAIATDHAPHTARDKAAGAPGISGLETAFALCHGALVETGQVSLSRLSGLLSAGPARLLGLSDRGRLDPGLRADLVLADPGLAWTCRAAALRSRGNNTPLEGRGLRGRILMTFRQGRLVYAN